MSKDAQARNLIKKAQRARQQRPGRALELLRHAERLGTASREMYALQSLCHLQLRQSAEAVTAAQRCVELEADNYSYGILTQALLVDGQQEKAIMLCPHAVQMDGKIYDFVIVAEALRRQKRYQEALRILVLVGEDVYPKHLCAAFCHMHLGQHQQSLASFMDAERVLREWPEPELGDPRMRLYCGYIFLYSEAKGVNGSCPEMIVSKFRWATNKIRSFNTARIDDFQRSDYFNALEIAGRNGR